MPHAIEYWKVAVIGPHRVHTPNLLDAELRSIRTRISAEGGTMFVLLRESQCEFDMAIFEWALGNGVPCTAYSDESAIYGEPSGWERDAAMVARARELVVFRDQCPTTQDIERAVICAEELGVPTSEVRI